MSRSFAVLVAVAMLLTSPSAAQTPLPPGFRLLCQPDWLPAARAFPVLTTEPVPSPPAGYVLDPLTEQQNAALHLARQRAASARETALAADAGDPVAQFAVAKMYELGDGVERDEARALCWFTKAADHGHREAQGALAGLYFLGISAVQSYPAALRWATLGAENGDGYSTYVLGMMYLRGEGVLQDYQAASRWFLLGAERGEAFAQIELANMHLRGQVTGSPDYLMAYFWLNIAAAHGPPWAPFQRDDVARDHLTATEVLEAQRLAREWLAAHPDAGPIVELPTTRSGQR